MADHEAPQSKSKEWNYTPELPLTPAPYWNWPPQPLKIVQFWFFNFLQFSDRALFLLLAFIIAYSIQPVTAQQSAIELQWVFGVFDAELCFADLRCGRASSLVLWD